MSGDSLRAHLSALINKEEFIKRLITKVKPENRFWITEILADIGSKHFEIFERLVKRFSDDLNGEENSLIIAALAKIEPQKLTNHFEQVVSF